MHISSNVCRMASVPITVSRFDLLHQPADEGLLDQIRSDIAAVSPETTLVAHPLPLRDAWDFEEVYAALHRFAGDYPFDTDANDYWIHITTGTHVAQICLFLLTESRHLPGVLLQSSPPKRKVCFQSVTAVRSISTFPATTNSPRDSTKNIRQRLRF